jgi:O-succinylbenzoic acid--CoA ligase
LYPNLITKRASLTPDKTAIIFGNERWSFKEVEQIAIDMAGKLLSVGIEPGMRIALLSPTNVDFLKVIYGCMYAGCEMVFLNERLTNEELKYQVEDSNAVKVLVDDCYETKLMMESVCLFSTLNQVTSSKVITDTEWHPNRTISIMYTSGTTGFPKGVRQTMENHFSSATASAFNIGVDLNDVWLCTMPLFHISGFSILMRSLVYGIGIKMYAKFDAELVTQDLVEGNVTHISVVSVMLERILTLLEQQNVCVSPQFKIMLAGGGPIPIAYLERAQAKGIPVLQTYGMTETSSQTTTLAAEDAKRKIGSSGKPLLLNEIIIDGMNSPHEIGEILIKGPHVTPGYIGHFANHPAQKNGWLYTGDVGYLDEEGYLYVVDRRSDLIISGGENIYPAQVENALLKHPDIFGAGVCGYPDDQWGEVPVAFIMTNKEITLHSLQQFLANHLASFKIPKALYIVEELPRNASNKLLRRELKKWLLSK